jgi:AcrR family transcriptional regulator
VVSTNANEKTKKPPQARSVKTRAALLEAAIACVAEHGLAATTMAVVAERAGVSRGASQHHFHTRDELLAAAVEHVLAARTREVRERTQKLAKGARRTETVLTRLASFYEGPLFVAAVQVWVGAVSDETLRARLAPLEARAGREVHKLALELLDADESIPGVRETVQATLDLVRGLGLANFVGDDSVRRKKILQTWAQILDRELERARTEVSARKKRSS